MKSILKYIVLIAVAGGSFAFTYNQLEKTLDLPCDCKECKCKSILDCGCLGAK